MRKISKWSLVGMIGGALFSLLSAIRYYLIYPDLDKAIVYVIIGIIIMGEAWIYNAIFEINKSLSTIEDYLDEISKEKEDKENDQQQNQ